LPDLTKEPEGIDQAPVLDDSAVHQSYGVNRAKFHLALRRRGHELSVMGADEPDAHHDLVALRDQVVDRSFSPS
jgi:hypothetical protein